MAEAAGIDLVTTDSLIAAEPAARGHAAWELALVREVERARVASVFLSVVDGVEDALTYARQVSGALAEDMESIRERAVATLERLGYPVMQDVDVPADPRIDVVDGGGVDGRRTPALMSSDAGVGA